MYEPGHYQKSISKHLSWIKSYPYVVDEENVNVYTAKSTVVKLVRTDVRSFNMEIFIKAQFSIVQMSSWLKLHAVAWFEARY